MSRRSRGRDVYASAEAEVAQPATPSRARSSSRKRTASPAAPAAASSARRRSIKASDADVAQRNRRQSPARAVKPRVAAPRSPSSSPSRTPSPAPRDREPQQQPRARTSSHNHSRKQPPAEEDSEEEVDHTVSYSSDKGRPSGVAYLSPDLLGAGSASAAPAAAAPAAVPSRPPPSPTSLARIRHAAELGKMQLGFHNDQYIEDISVEFLYKPHTVTALLLVVGVLVFFAFRADPHPDLIDNLRVGAAAASFFILVLGLLVFPSGPFIRPHPLVWRLAFGVGIIYEIWLILILFQSKQSARESMKFFDSTLGVPVSERSYAANCDVTWSNVMSNVDIFVLSHFLGWVVKALIIRDALICWVVSIQWELLEIFFMHMLPNFAECWWDQWVLDVLLSNALGIWIGCKLAKYLEVKEYKWGSYTSIPSYLGKAKRTLMQFTPASWTKVEWKGFSSMKRIVAVQLLIVCMHVEELNAFFLKYILWVPPESKLNLVRLIIWAFVGVPSLRQIYQYMSDPRCKRIGHQTFLSLIILITELVVIFKFGAGEFDKPMPTHRRNASIAIFSAYCLGLLVLMLRTRSPTDEEARLKAKGHTARAEEDSSERVR